MFVSFVTANFEKELILVQYMYLFLMKNINTYCVCPILKEQTQIFDDLVKIMKETDLKENKFRK